MTAMESTFQNYDSILSYQPISWKFTSIKVLSTVFETLFVLPYIQSSKIELSHTFLLAFSTHCFDLQESSALMGSVLPADAHCCPHFSFREEKLFSFVPREHPDNGSHFLVELECR